MCSESVVSATEDAGRKENRSWAERWGWRRRLGGVERKGLVQSPFHSLLYLLLRQDWAGVLGTACSHFLPQLQKCGQPCVAVLTLHD